VPTEIAFFNLETATRLRDRYAADLTVANNVFAHAPDINGFARGLSLLLKPEGTVTIEVPHLLRMISERQFDTIYHEHVFYLSLRSVEAALGRFGLSVYDVELLPTHGGSILIYAAHQSAGDTPSANVFKVRQAELDPGLDRMETYRGFATAVAEAKRNVSAFLGRAARQGKRIAGYSATAKKASAFCLHWRRSASRRLRGGSQPSQTGATAARNASPHLPFVTCFRDPPGLLVDPGVEHIAGTENVLFGRGGRIRTSDLLVPNQALYQAEPRPDDWREIPLSSLGTPSV
jgi:C-methyltransferase C-terminal domain